MASVNLVNIECICSPDVHLGDGRVLAGPQREGTKVITPGQVSAVSQELAMLLIDNGQAKETKREPTVFLEDTCEYKVKVAQDALATRRADPQSLAVLKELMTTIEAVKRA